MRRRTVVCLGCLSLFLAGCPPTTPDEPPQRQPEQVDPAEAQHPRVAEIEACDDPERLVALLDGLDQDREELGRAVADEGCLAAARKLLAASDAEGDPRGALLLSAGDCLPGVYPEYQSSQLREAITGVSQQLLAALLESSVALLGDAPSREDLEQADALLVTADNLSELFTETMRRAASAAWEDLGLHAAEAAGQALDAENPDLAEVAALLRIADSAAWSIEDALGSPASFESTRKQVEGRWLVARCHQVRQLIADAMPQEADALLARVIEGSPDLVRGKDLLQEVWEWCEESQLSEVREAFLGTRRLLANAALARGQILVNGDVYPGAAAELFALGLEVVPPEEAWNLHFNRGLLRTQTQPAAAVEDLQAALSGWQAENPEAVNTDGMMLAQMLFNAYFWLALSYEDEYGYARDADAHAAAQKNMLASLDHALQLGARALARVSPDDAKLRSAIEDKTTEIELQRLDRLRWLPGQEQAALAACEALLEKLPEHAPLHLVLAELVGDSGRARVALDAALALEPDNHQALFNRGALVINEAVAVQRQSYETEDFDEADALTQQVGELYQEARPFLERALAIQPASEILQALIQIALFEEDGEGFARYKAQLEELQGQ